jgi:acyl-CoA dehydrogenase
LKEREIIVNTYEVESTEQEMIRKSVRSLCERFPENYWRELDERDAYPTAFVQALTD